MQQKHPKYSKESRKNRSRNDRDQDYFRLSFFNVHLLFQLTQLAGPWPSLASFPRCLYRSIQTPEPFLETHSNCLEQYVVAVDDDVYYGGAETALLFSAFFEVVEASLLFNPVLDGRTSYHVLPCVTMHPRQGQNEASSHCTMVAFVHSQHRRHHHPLHLDFWTKSEQTRREHKRKCLIVICHSMKAPASRYCHTSNRIYII